MKPIEQIIQDYDAVEVPVGVTHDLSEYNYDTVQWEFFGRIMDALGFDSTQRTTYFEPRNHRLVPSTAMSTTKPTDDFLTELQLRNAQTLALTFRTRDQLNDEIVHFAKIPLQERTIAYLGILATHPEIDL